MSLLIKNNNKKSLSSSSTIATTKTSFAADPNRTRAAITLHKYPTIKSTLSTTRTPTTTILKTPSSSSSSVAAAVAAAVATSLLSPSVEATSNVDTVSSSSSSSAAAAAADISLFSLMEQPVELTEVTSAGSVRKVFRTMPSFKIMSYQNFIALLTVLVCGLVTVNGLKCYMCGQYNEGVGSITPCLNYSEQYAHLYLKECSKKSEKYCVKYVSELSIVRDCATECAEKEIWETQTYCCTEDGCNGSSTIEASAVVIMLPLFIYIVNEIMNILKQQRR